MNHRRRPGGRRRQRGGHRPARIAADKGARAVDRIDDEQRAARRGASASSAVSSDSQPASGKPAPSRAFRSASAARSASVTGEPPTLVSIRADVAAPWRKNPSASAPASRAASVRTFARGERDSIRVVAQRVFVRGREGNPGSALAPSRPASQSPRRSPRSRIRAIRASVGVNRPERVCMDWSPHQKFGVASREEIAGLSGREFLQAMIEGRIPAPPIGKTMSFKLVEVGDGFAIFEGEPGHICSTRSAGCTAAGRLLSSTASPAAQRTPPCRPASAMRRSRPRPISLARSARHGPRAGRGTGRRQGPHDHHGGGPDRQLARPAARPWHVDIDGAEAREGLSPTHQPLVSHGFSQRLRRGITT